MHVVFAVGAAVAATFAAVKSLRICIQQKNNGTDFLPFRSQEFGYDETPNFDPMDLCDGGIESALSQLASAMASKRGAILKAADEGEAER